MWPARTTATVLATAVLCSVSSACSDSDSGEPTAPPPPATGELVVTGSAQPASALSVPAGATAPPVGAPSAFRVGLYSFHISEDAACSGPFLTAHTSSSPGVHDFTASPVLFRATGLPVGTYPCVAMRISDILVFESSVTSGACSTGTVYSGDVYRVDGEDEPFRDLSLAPITATGTDEAPSEDGIFLLFTTNPGAAITTGFAPNQVIGLSSPLSVPDAVTFVWDVSNAVIDEDGRCLLEPAAPGLFR